MLLCAPNRDGFSSCLVIVGLALVVCVGLAHGHIFAEPPSSLARHSKHHRDPGHPENVPRLGVHPRPKVDGVVLAR